MPSADQTSLSYKSIIHQAWPIMLANMALPLLGLIDTAIIGHLGNASDLAALAVSSIVINFIFWNFGFLRMSTTALSAQAWGRNNTLGLINTGLRAFFIAAVLALGIILLQKPLILLALKLLNPPPEAINGATTYLAIRLWGAPATLCNYVITGLLIGLARSKSILALQLILNFLNAIFDVVLAGTFNLGIAGIAYGTVIAEVITVFIGGYLLHLTWQNISWKNPTSDKKNLLHHCKQQLFNAQLWNKKQFSTLLTSNRDIWIRTLCLLLSFMGFTYFSGQFGVDTLAANHLLLQIIVFSAFFLDSFAYISESFTGKAIGSRSKSLLLNTAKKTSVLAMFTALLLAIGIISFGHNIIAALTVIDRIQMIALENLHLCALYVLLSVAAFQLDGIFIGANYGKALRNASIASALLFFLLWLGFLETFNLTGLWWALISFVVLRAICLAAYWPSLIKTRF